MNIRERFLATMNYQERDRCPWGEMGFWPETLERWHGEGWSEDVELNQFFGFDRLREQVNVSLDFVPAFETEVLEETEKVTGKMAQGFGGSFAQGANIASQALGGLAGKGSAR